MSNKPEHTADISAELRTLSRSAKQYGLQPTAYGKPINIYFAELVDRLDAANKRELATTENPSAVGDVAKLRKALVKIAELAASREGVTSIELQVQGEALTALATISNQNTQEDNLCMSKRLLMI